MTILIQTSPHQINAMRGKHVVAVQILIYIKELNSSGLSLFLKTYSKCTVDLRSVDSISVCDHTSLVIEATYFNDTVRLKQHAIFSTSIYLLQDI